MSSFNIATLFSVFYLRYYIVFLCLFVFLISPFIRTSCNEWNFWTKEIKTGITREGYVNKLLEFISTNKIISIVGVRRSGKSTIIKQLARKLIENKVSSKDILIANFEEPMFENTDAAFLVQMYNAYKEIIGPENKPYIFLDEIQNVTGWERFVRSIQEKDEAYVVISGSSSKLISEELGTVLTGRQLYFDILPLTFQEFLYFMNLRIKETKDIIFQKNEIKKQFGNFVKIGGFPEIVLSDSEEFQKRVLLSYYEDIINRDIVQRYKIKKSSRLKALVQFYLTNIASHMSFNSISKFIKMPVETVRRYSSYAENAHLIIFLKRFSFSLKEQENSTRKVYSVDIGLAQRVGFSFFDDSSKALENIVALKLKEMQSISPSMEIFYWKNHAGDKEVDFVIKNEKSVTDLIQVCWDVENENTKKREIKALLKAMDDFKLNQGYILTHEFEHEEVISDKTIIYIPAWKWLLGF